MKCASPETWLFVRRYLHCLQQRGHLKGVQLSRITFTEVTKSAVIAALQSPRTISTPLVEAYLARRALDYLVGFHLSPLLWKKLPGARSAGNNYIQHHKIRWTTIH